MDLLFKEKNIILYEPYQFLFTNCQQASAAFIIEITKFFQIKIYVTDFRVILLSPLNF